MEIKTFERNNFETFLDDLKPNGLVGKNYSDFVFRGQSQDWKLLPSLFRYPDPNGTDIISILEEYVGPRSLPDSDKELTYRVAEINLLRNFYKTANRNGLKLPHVQLFADDYICKINLSYSSIAQDIRYIPKWFPDDLEELAGLAQHYGIPTRLIDWSFDLNVALYFAVCGIVEKIAKGHSVEKNKIVIWMLNANAIESQRVHLLPRKPYINFLIPNYYENPNLNAQKGVLTYIPTYEIDETVPVNKIPLDEMLKEAKGSPVHGETAMYKITLPATESVKIAKHLANIGYTAAKIFPGYAGTSKSIEEDMYIKVAERTLKQHDKTLLTAPESTKIELECLDKFNVLTEMDKGKILERMDAMYEAYDFKEKKKRSG